MSDCATTPREVFPASPEASTLDDSDSASGPSADYEVPSGPVPFALLDAIRDPLPPALSDLADTELLTNACFEPAPASSEQLVIGPQARDEELAQAACEGDPRAPFAIWRRYGTQVRSKLLRWIGPHDLDDHVQEVFSRLFEQLPRLRQPSALRSFLIGITLRVACTELRRRRRWRLRLTATGELPDLADQGTDDGTCREALTRFEAILAKLAPRTRRVFVLRYVEKLELIDVAAAMDISLATAKRHLSRASMRVFAMAEREPALVDYVRDFRSGARGSERRSNPLN
jgi:RNA polymerase sigma-70 factor, ECF subfamily